MACLTKALLSLVGCTSLFCGTDSLAKEPTSIAAFNIRIFGTDKAAEDETMDVLIKIIHRYDITLIQEIRDASETAIYKLLWKIQTDTKEFDMIISERLGSTNSKEQYAYIYRKDKGIQVTDTYQYPEPHTDQNDRTFERPPYCARFQIPNAVVQDLAIIGIHTDPDKAEAELNALVTVHDDIKSRWKMDNILLMGDFNADCSYLSKTKRNNLALRAEGYHWLISDDWDTTVAASDCAYDRCSFLVRDTASVKGFCMTWSQSWSLTRSQTQPIFVVSGQKLFDGVSPGSVKVFLFDEAYNLDSTQAKSVSDHYPIEMAIKGRESASAINNDSPGTCNSAGTRVRSFFSGLWD